MPIVGPVASQPVSRVTIPARITTNVRRQSHALYLALALVLVATVVRGFWPSYFGRLWNGTFQAHWVIHLHGAAFTG